ncbi:MAG: PilZ domain-containing protein [Candidatus Omnitrophica bacterium]|nr:PilZ domain-containing protein [Candidatus Omnitrophota bacterium]
MATMSGFDHRKFKRVPFKRPVKSKMINVEIYAGNLAYDISQGGIRINSSEFVAKGAHVILQVQLDMQGRLLELAGEVVWIRELPYSGGFQLGLQFNEGDSFEKCKIAQFVEKL